MTKHHIIFTWRELFEGGARDDQLTGGAEWDDLYGYEGNDRLRGGEGHDRLFGGAGDDLLWADAGDDQLYGGAGNDRFSGGAGDDQLQGGPGEDQLTGGEGYDLFIFEPGHSSGAGDVIMDYTASDDPATSDEIDLSAFNINTDGIEEGDSRDEIQAKFAEQGLTQSDNLDADGDGDLDDTIITLPDDGTITLLNTPADVAVWIIF